MLQRSAGQHLPVALKGKEEEELIVDDRAACRNPELILHFTLAWLAGKIVLKGVRIEDGALIRIARRGVIFVRAGLAHHVHRAAARASVPGVIGVGHHIDFADAVDIRRDGPLTGRVIVIAELAGDVRAVQGELIIADNTAAERVGVGDIPARGAVIAASAELRLRELAAGRGADQRIRLFALHGQALKFSLTDDGAAGTGGCLQLGRRAAHDYLLIDCADRQGEVLIEGLGGEQRHLVLHQRFEALCFGRHRVGARQYVGNVIDTLCTRLCRVAGARSVVDRRYAGVFDDGTGRIGDLPGECGAKLLRMAGSREQKERQKKDSGEPEEGSLHLGLQSVAFLQWCSLSGYK